MIIDPVAVELYILRSLQQHERNSAGALGLWQLEARLYKNGQAPFWLPLVSVKGLPAGPVDEPRLQAMALDLKQVPFQVLRHTVKTVATPPPLPITEAELFLDAELPSMDSAAVQQALSHLQTGSPDYPPLVKALIDKPKPSDTAWFAEARAWIIDHYDVHYLAPAKRPLKPEHPLEAMLFPNRPLRTPKKTKKTLPEADYRIYSRIWERFMAWQMIPMTMQKMDLAISAGKNNRYLFQRQSVEIINRGFLQMMPAVKQPENSSVFWKSDSRLSTGDELELFQVRVEKRKAVVSPSSTAALYAERTDPQFISTRDFREILFSLARQEYIVWDKTGWRLGNLDEHKAEEIAAYAKNGPGQALCEKCGHPMVLKQGPYGRFWGCSTYPRCRHTLPMQSVLSCPATGCSGRVVERKTKSGKRFFGCSRYPECRFASWNKPTNINCHHCHRGALEEVVDERGQELLICPHCGSSFPKTKPEWMVAS